MHDEIAYGPHLDKQNELNPIVGCAVIFESKDANDFKDNARWNSDESIHWIIKYFMDSQYLKI